MPVIGAAFNPATPTVAPTIVPATPTFDADNVPNYSTSLTSRIAFRNQTRVNTNVKYKLWPIPQTEIDNNPGLTQNTGW
jgi:hypothetical protein